MIRLAWILILSCGGIVMLFACTSDQPPQDWFLGKWAASEGIPGNYIEFTLVESPGTESTDLLKAWEGRVAVSRLFGQAEETGIWNYGYRQPMALNMGFDEENYLLILQKINDNQIRARRVIWNTNPEASLFDHSDTIILIREISR